MSGPKAADRSGQNKRDIWDDGIGRGELLNAKRLTRSSRAPNKSYFSLGESKVIAWQNGLRRSGCAVLPDALFLSSSIFSESAVNVCDRHATFAYRSSAALD